MLTPEQYDKMTDADYQDRRKKLIKDARKHADTYVKPLIRPTAISEALSASWDAKWTRLYADKMTVLAVKEGIQRIESVRPDKRARLFREV